MRYAVKLNLDLIQSWASLAEAKNEKQKSFVISARKACDELRKEKSAIVLEADDGIVLHRLKDGVEQEATGDEICAFYAQAIANGEMQWETFF